MACFLCNHSITPSEACGALEFSGDALAERGRYAVHRECLRPEWKKRFVTRDNLLHPETMSLVVPQVDIEQAKWWHEAQQAPPSPLRRALANFFAWGSKQFAVEPLAPEMLGYNKDGSRIGKFVPPTTPVGLWKQFRRALSGNNDLGASLKVSQQNQKVYLCAYPGCAQSPGATGLCTQHQWRASVVAEPVDEPPLPSVYSLSRYDAMEAMHKHARCCVHDTHFQCAEFVCLARQYIDQGGAMQDFMFDWGESWNPYEDIQVQSERFFVVRNTEEV